MIRREAACFLLGYLAFVHAQQQVFPGTVTRGTKLWRWTVSLGNCRPRAWVSGDSAPTCASKLLSAVGEADGGDANFYKAAAAVSTVVVNYAGVELAEAQVRPEAWSGEVLADKACRADDRFCRRLWQCDMDQKIEDKPEDGAYDWQTDWTLRTTGCLWCGYGACEDLTCGNEELPMEFLASVGKDGYQLPVCARDACEPGTFLSCQLDASCRYKVALPYHAGLGADGTEISGLSAEDRRIRARDWYNLNKYGSDKSDLLIVPDAGVPIKQCFPCKFASGYLHYGRFLESPTALLTKGFLNFECPGRGRPPVPCGPNMVSRVDPATNRSGVCDCADGNFRQRGSGACAACPAGFACKWSGGTPPSPVQCPTDTYSTGGASECKPCTKNYAQCGRSQALTRCSRDSGGTGEWQRADAQCVDCNLCKQLNPDGVPCYRVAGNYSK